MEKLFDEILISLSKKTKGKKNTRYTLTGEHTFTLKLTRKIENIYVFAKSDKLKGSQKRNLPFQCDGQNISFKISPEVIKELFQVNTRMIPFPICLDFGAKYQTINFRVRKTRIYKKK